MTRHNTVMADHGKQLSKKRVSKACDCCRKSKTKCDGMRPCKRCLEDGKICTYMNKTKEDKVYPASYVDLLETRVSVLVQALSSLLSKFKDDADSETLLKFCQDPELLNQEGSFDINKVICNLLSTEKLDNLAESNHDYSIDEITNVTGNSENVPQRKCRIRNEITEFPSSTPSSINQHPQQHLSQTRYPLSKTRANSEINHIRKSTLKRNHANRNSHPSTSFQPNFDLNSPALSSQSSAADMRNSSLDITSSQASNVETHCHSKTEQIESNLESPKSLSNTDCTSSSTVSPTENNDSVIFSMDNLQKFDDNLDVWSLNQNMGKDLNELGYQSASINGLNNPYSNVRRNSSNLIKTEPLDQMPMINDSFNAFNMKYDVIFD